MCVVPMFLAAASRLRKRTGIRAPSGIWNGRVLQLTRRLRDRRGGCRSDTSRCPTESGNGAAVAPGWYSVETSCSTTVSQRLHAARLADVGKLRQPVRRAHDVRTQLDLGCAASPGRAFRLQPIQEAEADALGILQAAATSARARSMIDVSR
jgi:hypothetical protein